METLKFRREDGVWKKLVVTEQKEFEELRNIVEALVDVNLTPLMSQKIYDTTLKQKDVYEYAETCAKEKIDSHNNDEGAHPHIQTLITNTNTNLNELDEAVNSAITEIHNTEAAIEETAKTAIHLVPGIPVTYKRIEFAYSLENIKNAEEGLIFNVDENGETVQYKIIKIGYESDLNGGHHVLVVRNNVLSGETDSVQFSNQGNVYENSILDKTLEAFGKKNFEKEAVEEGNGDADPQLDYNSILDTNILFTPFPGYVGTRALKRRFFALSAREFSEDITNVNDEGETLPELTKLSFVANQEEWTRSVINSSTSINSAAVAITDGAAEGIAIEKVTKNYDATAYYRPAFCIPDRKVLYLGEDGKLYTENEITKGATLIQKDGSLEGKNVTEEVVKALHLPNSKHEIGSYIGTNVFGVNSPNELQFDFDIEYIMLIGSVNNNQYTQFPMTDSTISIMAPKLLSDNYTAYQGFTKSRSNSYALYDKLTHTFKWYNTNSAANQCNSSQTFYYYLAVGTKEDI